MELVRQQQEFVRRKIKRQLKEYEERGIKFTFSTGRIDNELEEVSSKMHMLNME